jgi:serine/threonine protein kinase
MVAGCSPFVAGTSNEIISAILSKEPPPSLARYSRLVPERLEEIVEKTLIKNKDERYQTSNDLLIDLKRLKQSLELKAGIERSTSPDKFGVPSSGGQSSVTSLPPEVGTLGIPPASSAEYLVSGIKQHKLGAALVSSVMLLAIGIGYWFFFHRSSNVTTIDSIAVLPFENVTHDQKMEYLSDGVTESLINSLSQLPHIKVIACSSVFS